MSFTVDSETSNHYAGALNVLKECAYLLRNIITPIVQDLPASEHAAGPSSRGRVGVEARVITMRLVLSLPNQFLHSPTPMYTRLHGWTLLDSHIIRLHMRTPLHSQLIRPM